MSDEIPSYSQVCACGKVTSAKYNASSTRFQEMLKWNSSGQDEEKVKSKERDNENDSASQATSSSRGAIRKSRRPMKRSTNTKPQVTKNIQNIPSLSEFPPLREIPPLKEMFPTKDMVKNTFTEQQLIKYHWNLANIEKRTYADVVCKPLKESSNYQGAFSHEKPIPWTYSLEFANVNNTLELNDFTNKNSSGDQTITPTTLKQPEEEDSRIGHLVAKLWHYGHKTFPDNVEQSTSYFSDPPLGGWRLLGEEWSNDTNSVLDDLENVLKNFNWDENSTDLNKSTNEGSQINTALDHQINKVNEKVQSVDINGKNVEWVHCNVVPNVQNTRCQKEKNSLISDTKPYFQYLEHMKNEYPQIGNQIQNQVQNQNQNEIANAIQNHIKTLVQDQWCNQMQGQNINQLQKIMQFKQSQQKESKKQQMHFHQLGMQKAIKRRHQDQQKSSNSFQRRLSYLSLPDNNSHHFKDQEKFNKRGVNQVQQVLMQQDLPDENQRFQFQHLQQQNLYPIISGNQIIQEQSYCDYLDLMSQYSQQQCYQPLKMLSQIQEYQQFSTSGLQQNYQNSQCCNEHEIHTTQELEDKKPETCGACSERPANLIGMPCTISSTIRNDFLMKSAAQFKRVCGQHYPQNAQLYSRDERSKNVHGKWSTDLSGMTEVQFSHNKSKTETYAQHYPPTQGTPPIQIRSQMHLNRENMPASFNKLLSAGSTLYEEATENRGQCYSKNIGSERERPFRSERVTTRNYQFNWTPNNYIHQYRRNIQQSPLQQSCSEMQENSSVAWNREGLHINMSEEGSEEVRNEALEKQYPQVYETWG